MRPIALIVTAATLAACQSTPEPAASVASAAVDPATCGANALQSFVGGPLSAAQQAAGQSITRVYARGDAIDLMLLPERVNIVTDGAGTVLGITCG